MKKNDILIIEIVSMSSEGMGIGKNDEYVFFVPYTYIGDIVKVKILKIKKHLVYCKVIEFMEKSEFHSNFLCDNYIKCGGCSLLHIKYEKQLEFKKTKVCDAIKRIGKLDVKVHDVTPSNEFGYRNKVLVPVGEDSEGNNVYGFFRRKSHDITDTAGCLIQDKCVNEICEKILSWMNDFGIKAYNAETGNGTVRHIYVRKAFSTGKMMAGVVAAKKEFKGKSELPSYLCDIDGVSSVILNYNPEKTNVILGKETFVLHGEEYLTDSLLGKEFLIRSLSFYQINREQTERLYKKAGELLQLTYDDVLYDIYCGIGTIGICLGDNVKKVIGAEIIPEAVELAKINANKNNIADYEYIVGKAEDISFVDKEHPTAVVIDPPRKGCDEKLIETLLKLKPDKICYISCDCATLARDLKIFKDIGEYIIGDIYPFDMFPNTEHVECCVLLQRPSLPDGK